MAKVKTKTTSVAKKVAPTTPKVVAKLTSKPAYSTKYMSTALAAELATLKTNGVTATAYKRLTKSTFEKACEKLRMELEIGKVLRSLPTAQGRRIPSSVLTKQELIEKLFGLTPKAARLIQELDEECVKKAILQAKLNGDIPSRNAAITHKHKEKNAEENCNYACNTVYATDRPEDRPVKESPDIYYTQLFANGGIGEHYLEEIGWHSAVSNELIPTRAEWYRAKYPKSKMIVGDIKDPSVQKKVIELHKESGCRAILASPPCQQFSKAGNQNYDCDEAKLYLEVIKIAKALDDYNDAIMIENVPEFLSAKPQWLPTGYNNIGEHIKAELESLKYNVNIGIVDAADYGTGQTRRRCVICASKRGVWKMPKPDMYKTRLMDIIGHLESLEAGQAGTHPYHFAPSLAKVDVDVLAHTPTGQSAQNNPLKWRLKTKSGGTSLCRYNSAGGRNDWGKPCSTLTQNSDSITGHTTIHPGRPLNDGTWSDARCFTWLELILISGLPEDYEIPKIDLEKGPVLASNSLVRSIIGESFAPKMVKRLIQEYPL